MTKKVQENKKSYNEFSVFLRLDSINYKRAGQFEIIDTFIIYIVVYSGYKLRLQTSLPTTTELGTRNNSIRKKDSIY